MSIKEQLQDINRDILKMTTETEYNNIVNQVKTLGKQYKELYEKDKSNAEVKEVYKSLIKITEVLKTKKKAIIANNLVGDAPVINPDVKEDDKLKEPVEPHEKVLTIKSPDS